MRRSHKRQVDPPLPPLEVNGMATEEQAVIPMISYEDGIAALGNGFTAQPEHALRFEPVERRSRAPAVEDSTKGRVSLQLLEADAS